MFSPTTSVKPINAGPCMRSAMRVSLHAQCYAYLPTGSGPHVKKTPCIFHQIGRQVPPCNATYSNQHALLISEKGYFIHELWEYVSEPQA